MASLKTDIDSRNRILLGLLLTFLTISLVALSEVFWTIFLAGVFSYVLYPFKQKLKGYSLSERQSAIAVTLISFLSLMLLVIPVFIVLFERRQILIDFIATAPKEITLDIMEFTYTIQTSRIEQMAATWTTDTAVKIAESLPSLSIKAFLFMFVLYAFLRHTETIKASIENAASEELQNIVYSYHDRVKKTLNGIFAVQALTSVLTFVIALPVFYLLGYDAFISLAVISAALQFIPIIGPSFLIIALAGLEISVGTPIKAFMIFILGIVIIGFLPDAYLRPRLANKTTGLPASLYFVGFAGGALTLGAVGVLAGPLLIALLVETFELLTEQ